MYQQHHKRFLADSLFIGLIYSNIILLTLDMITWILDGRPGLINSIALMITMVLYYLFNVVPSFLWVLYADFQVFHNPKRIRKLSYILLIPSMICIILTLITPFTGLIFYFDTNNVYHRGPLFLYFLILIFSYLIYAFFLLIAKRNLIDKRYFLPLILFALPPFLFGLIQACFYGLALIWSSITLSLLIIHLYVQNRKITTDYLTGIYNRLQLDRYLQAKILNSYRKGKFSAILLDIDDFKEINDHLGHVVGDEALNETVYLLKRSLRKEDFLSRYGGDEFFIIVDIGEMIDLENTVARIEECFEDFNQHSSKPYKLNLSMGYDIYAPDIKMNAEEFLKHLDDRMYEHKRSKAAV